MDFGTLYKMFIERRHEQMCFVYHGHFHDDVTGMVIDLSNSVLEYSRQSSINNKVSFLIAECFQNILRNTGNQPEDSFDGGLFSISDVGESIYISSLGPIGQERIHDVVSFIDRINAMNKDELKQLYLSLLDTATTPQDQMKLSLIEIVRRSGNPVVYYTGEINDYHNLFYLQIQLNVGQKKSLLHNRINFEIAKNTFQQVQRQHIYIIHKGNFSHSMIMPIIEMTEKNLDQKVEFHNKKRSFHVLVELLQNISKHGYEMDGRREGIFALLGEKGYFSIMAGNYVANSQVERLKLLLDFINENQVDDVMEYYKAILRHGKPTERGGAGVGLIDILRNSKGKIEYRIYPVNAAISFYCIKIRISLT